MSDSEGRSWTPYFIAGGAILLAILVSGGALLYNPAPDQANTPSFLESQSENVPARSIEVTSRLHASPVDGEQTTLFFDRTVYDAGQNTSREWFRVEGDGDVETATQVYRSGVKQYKRVFQADDDQFNQSITYLVENADRVNNSTNVYVTASETEERPTRETVRVETIALDALAQFPWEKVGETTYNGRAVVEYRPTDGWHSVARNRGDGTTSFYISEASGRLFVDAETGLVVLAEVDGRIVQASSWAEVYMHKTVDVTVAYQLSMNESISVSSPEWIDGLNATSSDAGSE